MFYPSISSKYEDIWNPVLSPENLHSFRNGCKYHDIKTWLYKPTKECNLNLWNLNFGFGWGQVVAAFLLVEFRQHESIPHNIFDHLQWDAFSLLRCEVPGLATRAGWGSCGISSSLVPGHMWRSVRPPQKGRATQTIHNSKRVLCRLVDPESVPVTLELWQTKNVNVLVFCCVLLCFCW